MTRDNYKNNQKILIAVDCIVFGFDGTQLNALLIKRGFGPELGQWSLMGGFIRNEEDARSAAGRVLYELTGMEDLYMEQLHTFTDVHRDTANRVISIAYFSLIKITNYHKNPLYPWESQWFPLSCLPELIFDHCEMIEKAKDALRRTAANNPVGFELLPAKFTIPQLRTLYEAIYEIPLDQRNFAKKILSLDILTKLDEKEKSGSRKGAFLYNFDINKYNKKLPFGVKLIHLA
jgi:8-oxo-dGTP diphosphatase